MAGHLGHPLPPDAPRQLAEALSRRFTADEDLQRFYREGFAPLRGAYTARCVNLGRQVWFEGGEGVAETVDEQGRLVVQEEGGAAALLFHRKLRSYETKTLRKDRTAAEMKMALERPAAGGESCVAGFFFTRA